MSSVPAANRLLERAFENMAGYYPLEQIPRSGIVSCRLFATRIQILSYVATNIADKLFVKYLEACITLVLVFTSSSLLCCCLISCSGIN